jgi:hypothetical protein
MTNKAPQTGSKNIKIRLNKEKKKRVVETTRVNMRKLLILPECYIPGGSYRKII